MFALRGLSCRSRQPPSPRRALLITSKQPGYRDTGLCAVNCVYQASVSGQSNYSDLRFLFLFYAILTQAPLSSSGSAVPPHQRTCLCGLQGHWERQARGRHPSGIAAQAMCPRGPGVPALMQACPLGSAPATSLIHAQSPKDVEVSLLHGLLPTPGSAHRPMR